MDDFLSQLNRLLLSTYRDIERIEERMTRDKSNAELSINELHLIETIAKDKTPKSITYIAQEHSLSLPTVTVAINKLVKKGYVEKFRDEKDGRMVCVRVTPLGRKADVAHRYFHRLLLNHIARGFTDEEKRVLLTAIQRMDEYLQSVYPDEKK